MDRGAAGAARPQKEGRDDATRFEIDRDGGRRLGAHHNLNGARLSDGIVERRVLFFEERGAGNPSMNDRFSC